MSEETVTEWSYRKGIYCPPTKQFYPELKKREINISESIHEKIATLIGKDGCRFIHLTQKYNLLYIFYQNYKIELYGTNDENIMKAVHDLIRQIKYMNYVNRTQ